MKIKPIEFLYNNSLVPQKAISSLGKKLQKDGVTIITQPYKLNKQTMERENVVETYTKQMAENHAKKIEDGITVHNAFIDRSFREDEP